MSSLLEGSNPSPSAIDWTTEGNDRHAQLTPTSERCCASFGAATLGESGARIMAPRIAPAWPGARVAAPAFPVRCTSGDNLAIHVAVAEAPAGSVLVVDVGELGDFGYWGEVLTTGAQARGILGLVIDGGVRDIVPIETLGLPGVRVHDRLAGRVEEPGRRGQRPHPVRRRVRGPRRLDRGRRGRRRDRARRALLRRHGRRRGAHEARGRDVRGAQGRQDHGEAAQARHLRGALRQHR